MKYWLVLLALCLAPIKSAFSYNIILKPGLDSEQPTDVYLVGHGPEMGTLFLHAAVANARKMAELNPGRQQLIIWAKNQGKSEDKAAVSNLGFKIIESNSKKLTLEVVVDQMLAQNSISSFHYFGHSNAFSGAAFQGSSNWFSEGKLGVTTLKSKFTPDAFAIFHGCNSGFYTAPRLSRVWGIPVFGSLTSTDFVKLHSNGEWYNNNEGNFPAGVWAKTNEVSYDEPVRCSSFGCVKMKPDSRAYTGDFGNYRVGLGFYKAFCAFEDAAKCLKGTLKGALSFPSSHKVFDRESFKEHVAEILCPGNLNAARKENCHKTLKESATDLPIFNGKQLKCTLSSCEFTVLVEGSAFKQQRNFDGPDAGNTTLIEEFNLYLKAWDSTRE